MVARVSLVIIRIFLGLMFIYSGWTKVSPIEPLEFSMLEYTHLPWFLNSIIARLLISLEVLLGILLIFNFKHKLAIKFSMGLLFFFTFYLSYVLQTQGNDGNCGCFGIEHTFTPIEGIVKNIISLLLLFAYAKFNKYDLKLKHDKIIWYSLLASVVVFPQIKEPMDFSVEDKFDEFTGISIGLDSLSIIIEREQGIDLVKGKHLITFFSMKCKYCKLTSQKINLIAHRIDVDFSRFYFFGKEKKKIPYYEEDLKNFWKETKSDVVPNKMLGRDLFYNKAGYALPAIYLIEDGVVVNRLSFRSLDEDKIFNFFK